jgi:hypothetical protein
MRLSTRRASALVLPLALISSSLLASPALGAASEDLAPSAIDPAEFAEPGIDYRPGVRWWWPGNAASEEDLLAQVEYLHDNGFGAVEIVAFSKGFLTGTGTTAGYIYDGASLGYDVDQILSYESDEYFDKLDAVIERANELGIVVDLNVGSGYLASDDSIEVSESQSNLALGRATVSYEGAEGFTVTSGEMSVEGPGTLGIPEVEVSPFYASELFGFDFGVWSPEDVHLNAVVVAPVLGAGEAVEVNNQVLTNDFSAVKTYANRTEVDLAEATVVYPDPDAGTFDIDTAGLADGSYEVIAVYSAPAGSFGLNSIIENTTTDRRNYVVDHLDPEAVTSLVHGWLGHPRLREIVEEREVRAAFNDSYEFYTDAHYNDRVQAAATSEEILGYDLTRFVPAFYSFFGESFLIDGAPTIKPQYADEGLEPLTLGRFTAGTVPLLESGLSEDEAERVEYDYGRLLNESFLAGMAAFSGTLSDYGIVYRQQAYNPPVDTLKSAQYVDIPETEGLDEYGLKRAASGAHLYGRNLVTSEVYTLGSTPFTVTPDFIKRGYDLMATSGVNNFFYHGLSATYHGNTDPAFTSDDALFAEEGWRAWPTIGVEMAQTDPTSAYYASMNAYASRANFAMQAGEQSSDVAVYMPLFGAVASGGGFGGGSTPLESVSALQGNGYVWDAINDDTIQNGLEWAGGQLVANEGSVTFDSLVVEADTVPVETMVALRSLQDAGAPIFFLGEAPARQPGYAGGDYAERDAQVQALAAEMDDAVGRDALLAALAEVTDPPITYGANDALRMNRRTLPTGGELAYVRNTSATEANGVSFEVSSELENCSWLDPESGEAFAASLAGGTVNATLDPAAAVILLCEPSGIGLDAAAISDGAPAAIDATALPHAYPLTEFDLSVTADNIGTNVPGETRTVVFDEDVVGDWASDDVLGGQLKYVSSAGTYRTTVEVADADALAGGAAVLDLGAVRDAATVRVNPGTPEEFERQVYHAPFTVDISEALVDGENVIEIEVQPVKNNRRVGLKTLYASDPVANVQYQAYASVHGTNALMPAGLLGPIVLATTAPLTGGATPSPTPTSSPTPTAGPSAPADQALGGELVHEQVAPGQQQTLRVWGLEPGESVSAVMYSTPLDVGSVAADAQGVAELTWTVPSDTPPGVHRVEVTAAVSGSLSLTFVVTGALSVTGADLAWLALVAVLGVALVGIGAFVVIHRRRSRTALAIPSGESSEPISRDL